MRPSPASRPKIKKNGIPKAIKKIMDSRLKLRGSVSAGMTGKIEAKSAKKWLFHSPDLGVSMLRIIQTHQLT